MAFIKNNVAILNIYKEFYLKARMNTIYAGTAASHANDIDAAKCDSLG
jgi:hypothetical protein